MHILNRLLIPAAAAVMLIAVEAHPAAAHVTVNPREVTGGGYATLTFRMPNERDNARTTKLEVGFPAEQPLASVRVKTVPGWAYEIQKAKLDKPITSGEQQVTEVVRTVIWMAQGPDNAVKPTEFVEFDVSAGRLPDSGEMAFPAIQTYDSGEVVRWIERAAPGAQTPKHPAPILKLLPPPNPSAAPAVAAAKVEGTTSGGTNESTLPLVLSILATLLSAGALAGVVLRWRRDGSTRPDNG
jgi:uncharacterized protein YcnI